MDNVYIRAAKRSAVAPRGGAFKTHALADLAAPVLGSMQGADTDAVILGNALYGGGNPARVIALAAGFSETASATTIDTQCCAGLDAILLGAQAIKAGSHGDVIAGGAESYSRSPIRMHRPLDNSSEPEPYDRPPFTPWPDRDPDMIAAAATLAVELKIHRDAQNAFAVESHAKALAAAEARAFGDEIVVVADADKDTFTRALTPKTCERFPALAGEPPYDLSNATTAVEADGAAFVALTNERPDTGVRVVDGLSQGSDPTMPGLAPIQAFKELMGRNGLAAGDLERVELMEAFAAQAIAFVDACGISRDRLNVKGGGLARGHPIGASGAVLAVRLYHEMMGCETGALGAAAIAGAGGLASVVLLERI